jgi:dipeptidyl aminopeptidase/acylaminoacyl peptidase
MRQAISTILTVAMLLAGPAGWTAEKRRITEHDLLKFQWVADPQISPDGKQVAYVLVTVNAREDRYDTSVWLVAADGSSAPRQLTAGPRDSAPRWSPDGRGLAFLRAGEREPAQLYLLSLEGGEGRKLTDLPRGASAAIWSPDGKTIAFTSTTTPEDIELKRSGRPAPKKSDVRIITRAVFRFNGTGYLDPTRVAHIWTVPVDWNASEPAEARQITSGKYSEGGVFWSADGSRLYFTSNRVDEPYYHPPDSNLFSVAATGGTPQVVLDIDGPISDVAISPDGASIAFVGHINPRPLQSHKQTDINVWSGGKLRNLTEDYDFEIGSSVTADQHPPRGGGQEPLVWTRDGKALIHATTVHGRSNLVRIDVATAKVEPLTTGSHDIVAYTATPDAARFALTLSSPTRLSDLFLFDVATRRMTQLTRHNDPLFSTLDLTEPEEIWYTSFDGRKINAWVQRPPDFDPSRKYPLILNIHGGPHAAYGWTFFHEFQWMAAKGYVVLYPNPRGSTSYGQEFSNIIQHRYPGDDYKDLMAGVDELIRRGYIDEKRMGVTGGSGGGLLTNWTVTQTDRFAAAVSQRSVADWMSFWYIADFTLFLPTWFRSYPFRDPEEFLRRSPTRFAEQVKTPIMFIEGEEDYRTPPEQGGEAMFRALKALKKTAVMVRFPGENHDLSRTGKPSHRIERLQHILNWFDKYCLSADIKLYDLQ